MERKMMMHLDVTVLRELPIHHELLERAVRQFWSDERVLGLVIGGSIAQGKVDWMYCRRSDIEEKQNAL
jgi:hypothetical protein